MTSGWMLTPHHGSSAVHRFSPAGLIKQEKRNRSVLQCNQLKLNLQMSEMQITLNSIRLKCNDTCLDEADIFSVLSEALTAHVESVFTDQTVSVWANSAGKTTTQQVRIEMHANAQ